MVICGIVLDPEVFGCLRAERVRDSKEIGPNRREELFEILVEKSEEFEMVEIGSQEIDEQRNNGTNLTELEAIGFAEVLDRLELRKAYIDSASANSEKFREGIQENLDKDPDLVVEHKADENRLPVSAASILAKVRRDERIERLKEDYGEIGSGYPADDRTVDFLESWMENHTELPDITRKTWKTAQRIKSNAEK